MNAVRKLRRKVISFLVISLGALPASIALAQDPNPNQEVKVQATKILDESVEASASVTIISSDEIRLKKPLTVVDLLRDVPGLNVVRQGAVGQTASVFIRGARSEDTLVLIDGAEANDAMSPAGGYDFSMLSPVNIERIEVYRGPQSVRFGGGALGGVINIVTKEGKGPIGAEYLAEGGSFDTARIAAGFSGGNNLLGYSLAADALQTHGFSSASALEGNSEPDGAKIGTATGKIVLHPDAVTKVAANFRYAEADTQLDQFGGAGGDDPNYTAKTTNLVAGLEGDRRFFSDHLKSGIGYYFSELQRSDSNPPDQLSTSSSSDSFISETHKIDSNHELTIDDHNLLRLNLQWKQESGWALSNDSFVGETNFPRSTQDDFGAGVTYVYESPTWFGDLGVREDHVNIGDAKDIPTMHAAFGRLITETDTRVSATFGTGFKTPSLYQLYSTYGTPDLKGETSDTLELAVEQKLGSKLSGSVSYFQNHYRNMIDFDSASSKYMNVSSALSNGAEFQVSYHVIPALNLDLNYTYLDARNQSTGQQLVRRPHNSLNAFVRYAHEHFEIYFQEHHVGERDDIDPSTFVQEKVPSYDVFNVGASYAIYNWLKVNGRIQNLFDKKYEEVAGYGTPRFSYYLGLSGEI